MTSEDSGGEPASGEGTTPHPVAGSTAAELRPDAYGEAFAEVYDRWYDGVTDAEATADFVAARTVAPTVLELGSGTGRLARPLVTRGLDVVGLDASAAMLGRCHDRGLPARLRLVQADMAALPFALDGGFGAALLAFNTLFNLPSAEAQATALGQVAAVLAPGGVLIIEALDLSTLTADAGRAAGLRGVVDGVVTVIGTGVDPTRQVIRGQHTEIGDDGIVVRPWRLCWATPDQIDTFADTAGLTLRERVADWRGTPHRPDDDRHISVYGRPPIG